VIAALGGIPNAEADLAASAFARALKRLGDMIRTSRSGLELSERGFAADLDIAWKSTRAGPPPDWWTASIPTTPILRIWS
jgi:phosphosulfolactate phosphohydrolase-like enzyme